MGAVFRSLAPFPYYSGQLDFAWIHNLPQLNDKTCSTKTISGLVLFIWNNECVFWHEKVLEALMERGGSIATRPKQKQERILFSSTL